MSTTSQVSEQADMAYDRAWSNTGAKFPDHDTGWVAQSYPSASGITEDQLLSAEEVRKLEEHVLGKRGVPDGTTDLNDDVPDFIHIAAKAGPALDHLGRTPKERKDRKIKDEMSLIEQPQLPAIIASDNLPRRTITFLRDHELEYPDLYMGVYVAPDWSVKDEEARFARMFARSGCYKADTIEEASLVVFGGGTDVEPLLYGESNEHKHPSVYYSSERDAADMEIYVKCRDLGIPMMGVCRGAQFLHVMNGGKLYQDIDGHQGGHKAWALRERQTIENVSSVHHQSCMFNRENGMELLLTTSSKTTFRWLNADVKLKKPTMDVEAYFYRDTGCFGVQGHPEYTGYNKFTVWCLERINDLFLTSPDFEWQGKCLRMTKAAKDAKQIAAVYVENAYNQSKEA